MPKEMKKQADRNRGYTPSYDDNAKFDEKALAATPLERECGEMHQWTRKTTTEMGILFQVKQKEANSEENDIKHAIQLVHLPQENARRTHE
jgi:hypothetical protein